MYNRQFSSSQPQSDLPCVAYIMDTGISSVPLWLLHNSTKKSSALSVILTGLFYYVKLT